MDKIEHPSLIESRRRSLKRWWHGRWWGRVPSWQARLAHFVLVCFVLLLPLVRYCTLGWRHPWWEPTYCSNRIGWFFGLLVLFAGLGYLAVQLFKANNDLDPPSMDGESG